MKYKDLDNTTKENVRFGSWLFVLIQVVLTILSVSINFSPRGPHASWFLALFPLWALPLLVISIGLLYHTFRLIIFYLFLYKKQS
jgi:uncharacterized membrane protein